MQPAKALPALPAPPELEPDEKLVSETYEYLKDLARRHFYNSMLQAGNYLVRKYFEGDFERARNPRNAVKIESLNALTKRLQADDGHCPSKTWVYNAVKLAADEYLFQNFQTYGKLGLSHKVYLTHVKNPEAKKNLIKEAVTKSYTVAQTRARISEIQPRGRNGKVSLESLPQAAALTKIDRDELLRLQKEAQRKVNFHKEQHMLYWNCLEAIEKALSSIAEKRNSRRESTKIIDLPPAHKPSTREQGVI